MFLILSTCWHFLFSFWRLQTWLLSSRATSWRTWWSWLNWSRSSSCCTTRPRTAPEVTSYRSWRKLWPCASNPSTCPPLKDPSSDPPPTLHQRVSFQSRTWHESNSQREKKQTCELFPSLPHQSLVCLPVCLGISYSDVQLFIKWMHSSTNCKKQNQCKRFLVFSAGRLCVLLVEWGGAKGGIKA